MSANNNSRKIVYITGVAGFLGSHLCDRFIAEGHKVVGIDNFLTGSWDNIKHLEGNENFEFSEHNVTKKRYHDEKPDIVLHFACPASPVDYIKFPIHTLKVESLGTYYTIGAAKIHNARYVLASTSEVYGDPLEHPQNEEYWGHVNPIGVRSVYDEGKRFSEAMAMAYHREHGIDTRIARIFNTFGERMLLTDGRVVPNMVWQALNNKDVTVYGSGEQTRSFCYIKDMVEALYKISTKDGINGEVINLGNPEEYTINDFAKLIIKLTKSKSKIVHKDLPEDDPKRRCPDISKAKSLLEWSPKYGVEEGLINTINYIKRKC